MTDNYDALRNADSPEAFCAALEAIACDLHDEGAQLTSAFDDSGAGKPWHTLARRLEKASNPAGL